MGLLTFANFNKYSIQLNSPVILCLVLNFVICKVPMFNNISQCGHHSNLTGPLEPFWRSKDALQIQVRIVDYLVMEPLVWYIVNNCDICLNNCDICLSLGVLFIGQLVTPELNCIRSIYLSLLIIVCSMEYYLETSNLYFLGRLFNVVHRIIHKQPPSLLVISDNSEYD